MALTIKHLNGDASFMLTFDALLPGQPPFRILIDPWITGKSKIIHSKISLTTHKNPACISSLLELPEPDLVIISQNKSDHCNEDTLRQLPPKHTKTIILAEPGSARTIRGWKYFEKGKVRTIPRWEDPRTTGRQAVVRISVPAVFLGPSEPGEVTVAFISQRRDMSGLHAAIGITYRPPQVVTLPPHQPRRVNALTRPTTPRSHRSCTHLRPPTVSSPVQSSNTINPLPSPTSTPTRNALRSVRSTSSLATTMRDSCYSTASLASLDRPLSVIFSPHGIHYASLHSYTTSHLIAEAALPLTALLHCFDSVSNPWWLGGNLLLGAPAGIETASRLGARAWISTHDGDKIVKGIATGFLRTRKWQVEDVLGAMSSAELTWRREKNVSRISTNTSTGNLNMPSSPTSTTASTTEKVLIATNILTLKSGEEVILTRGPGLLVEPDNHEKIPEVPILKMPRAPFPTLSPGPSIPSAPSPAPPPFEPPSATKQLPKEEASSNDIQTTRGDDNDPQDLSGTNEPTEPTIPPTIISTTAPLTSVAPSTIPDQPDDTIPEARSEKEEGMEKQDTTATPQQPIDDENINTIPKDDTTPTAPPAPIALPELPAAFKERRWLGRRATVRGRGTNKTLSESDFASLEEIMMMRDY